MAAPPYTEATTGPDNTPTTPVLQEGEPAAIVLDALIDALVELAKEQLISRRPRIDTEQYDYNRRILLSEPPDRPHTEALPAYSPYRSSDGPRPSPPECRESTLFKRITDIFAEHPSLKESLGLPLTRCPPEYTAPPSYTASLDSDTTQPQNNKQTKQEQEHENPLPTNPKIIGIHRILITTFFFTLAPLTPPPSTPRFNFIPVIPDPHPLVARYLTLGFITPDTPSPTGSTPLLAAISARRPKTVSLLLSAGADPNLFGTVQPTEPGYAAVPLDAKALHRLTQRARRIQQYKSKKSPSTRPYIYQPINQATLLSTFAVSRTPLMVAAATGQLPLVRLLLTPTATTTDGPARDPARDDLIAPEDGQLALRLARDAGHTEIFNFLPARRGGEWKRWTTHHAVALDRAARAGRKIWRVVRWVGWDVPYFFMVTVPWHVLIKPVRETGRWLWVNRVEVGKWCVRQVKEMPRRLGWLAGEVWKGVKAFPGEVWEVMKEVPKVGKWIVKLVWKLVKRIPAAMKVLVVWVWDSLKAIGKATGDVFVRVVSVLHSVVGALLGWLKEVTLRDVWNGMCDVADAVFQRLPKEVLRVLGSLGLVVGKMLEEMFGRLGKVIRFVAQLLWEAVKYVPRQLWKILKAVWSSIAKGYHEIMVWINPKH